MSTQDELEIKTLKDRLWRKTVEFAELNAEIERLKAELAAVLDANRGLAGECLKLQGIAIERDRAWALAEKRRMELSEIESMAVIPGCRKTFGLEEPQEWLDEPKEVTNG